MKSFKKSNDINKVIIIYYHNVELFFSEKRANIAFPLLSKTYSFGRRAGYKLESVSNYTIKYWPNLP